MKKAVYAGSFDPLTNGHVWMIKEATKVFDELVIAIGVNPDKKYSFSLDERLSMIQATTRNYAQVTVDSFGKEFLITYAASVGAQFIVRGIRNETDYEYEQGMRHINGDINDDITTVFLMPPRNIAKVSSSLVKGLIGFKSWETIVKNYVPDAVYEKLVEKYAIDKRLA